MIGRKFFTRVVLVAVVAVAAHVVLLGDYSILKVGSLYFEKEDLKKRLAGMVVERDSLLRVQKRVAEERF